MAVFIGVKGDEIIASLMKELYSKGGYLPLAQFASFLNSDPKKASKWVSNNPKYFKIVNQEGGGGGGSNVLVLGITEVTFCKKHTSKPGSCLGCDTLHVCKYFALGNSCKFGANCKFCHNFGTVHNVRVLGKYHLQQLSEQELKCLFQKIENRCDVTIPMICKFFNNDCCKKKDCICLHICKHYLMNDCTFGKHCKINHNLDTRNIEILKMYGITFSSISDAVCKLRILYDDTQNNNSEADRPASSSELIKVPLLSGTKVNVICLHHLSLKQCAFKDTCRYYHKEMPYQWQFKIMNAIITDDDEWQNFNPVWNEQIEGKFCNLENETHITDMKSTAKFQFDTMKCCIAKQECLLHRLSTVSYKSDPRSHLATTWIWYWKDSDGVWIEYGSSSVDPIDVTNEDIEKNYLDNPDGTMVIQRDDNTKGLEINFQQMFQKCKSKREVIRRPKFVSNETAAELRQKPFKSIKKLNPNNETPTSNLPSTWEIPADVIGVSSHYKVTRVDKSKKEYKTVSDQFNASMKQAVITRIERIENGNLWEYYNWKKMKMTKEIGGEDIKELNLFHGTELDSIDAICKQGFDVRLSGIRIGSKYGKGIYFSKDSGFANRYIIPEGGECKVFLANVLIGEYVKGNPTYVRPPQKNIEEKGGKLYDSCVDNVNEPVLFVVFSNEQTYPAYIITYMKPTD